MSRWSFVLAATLIGAVAQPAAARDDDIDSLPTTGRSFIDFAALTPKPVVWVGGGVQFLSLPDIKFTGRGGVSDFQHQKNTSSDWLDAGGAVSGGFDVPLGGRISLSADGFYANVETDKRTNCSGSAAYCVVLDPTDSFVATSSSLVTETDRDTDYWGAQTELKFRTGAPAEVKPDMFRSDYFIAGFGVRGIDQENKLHSNTGIDFTYKETLDTTYVGGYVGIGGEYSFGFVPVVGKWLKGQGGLLDRWGLRTYLDATAGLYNADTSYTGGFESGAFNSRLDKSNDEVAFIGTLSLETRKQFGPRTSLSLFTDYEYISSVAKMDYATWNHATRIDSEGLFASRTTLRLVIGLGSSELYAREGYYD
jgi:hypothetical protein